MILSSLVYILLGIILLRNFVVLIVTEGGICLYQPLLISTTGVFGGGNIVPTLG